MNTEQERAELLPCPFCGSTNIEIQISTPDREGVPTNLMCSDCGASGPWEYEQGKSHAKADDAWNRRAALQSQDDWISPTSLTGLEKDELIRQLQWALDYWMPPIAGEGTPDGERASKEAYLLLGMRTPVGREHENTPSYWEKREALQSQDREDAERYRRLSSMATQQADSLGPIFRIDVRRTPQTMFNFDAAVDHARRVEGGNHE